MKKAHAVFTGLFLLIIVLPLLFIDRKSEISEKENRTLAVFPRIVTGDGRIDREHIVQFPRLVDSYINDRFGFRDTFTALANRVNKSSKMINGNVVIGKDGWLFLSNPNPYNASNTLDFFKMNLLSERELAQFVENLDRRRQWCDEHNIKFLFLIAPNKHNVYPEYYPLERPDGITRTEQIIAALPQDLKDTVIYPRDGLLQHKTGQNLLYFETDTHWNMAGTYIVYEILLDRMKKLFPQTNFPKINFVTDISYDTSGDIVPMLGFSNYGKRTIPDMRPVEGWEQYYRYKKNKNKDGVITENTDASLPMAIIFRDSFFVDLEPFTSTLFSSAEYHWRHFTGQDTQAILQNKPGIIIWEMVERDTVEISYSEWQAK